MTVTHSILHFCIAVQIFTSQWIPGIGLLTCPRRREESRMRYQCNFLKNVFSCSSMTSMTFFGNTVGTSMYLNTIYWDFISFSCTIPK